MTSTYLQKALAATTGVALIAGGAAGQQLITPVSATSFNSTAEPATDVGATTPASVDRLIDGSGLFEGLDGNGDLVPLSGPLSLANIGSVVHVGLDFGDLANATVLLTDDAGEGQSYLLQNDAPVIDFDLGGRFTLDSVFTFQYNDSFFGGSGNGVREFALAVSTDAGATYTDVINPDTSTTTFTLPTANFTGSAFADHGFIDNSDEFVDDALQRAQTLSLGGVTADLVRMTVLDNFFDEEFFGGERVGLGEVRFAGTAAGTLPDGDYNGSGQVEQGDLDLVLQNWGSDTDVAGVPAGWTHDLPSGQIEQTELDGVLQNWGNISAPDFAGGAVPEPTSAVVLAGVSLGLIGRRCAR